MGVCIVLEQGRKKSERLVYELIGLRSDFVGVMVQNWSKTYLLCPICVCVSLVTGALGRRALDRIDIGHRENALFV